MISPFNRTLSRPLNSGLKPAPSSSKAATRPAHKTRPLVGLRIPVMIWRSVLLPEPFGPSMAKTSPFFDSQVYVAQCPELGGSLSTDSRAAPSKAVDRMAIKRIDLGDVLGRISRRITTLYPRKTDVRFSLAKTEALRRMPVVRGSEYPIKQNWSDVQTKDYRLQSIRLGEPRFPLAQAVEESLTPTRKLRCDGAKPRPAPAAIVVAG